MKRFVSLVMAVLMIFSFAACAKKTEETPSDPNTPPELYVGEGFRTVLSTLMVGNFNIVEKYAVYGRPQTDENGRVSESAENDFAIDGLNSVITLFKSVYSGAKAEELVEKCGYYEKEGALYCNKKAKNEGTHFDLSNMKTEVTAKDDESCSFKVTVVRVSPGGAQKEKTFKCRAVYENSMWLLEDMYY